MSNCRKILSVRAMMVIAATGVFFGCKSVNSMKGEGEYMVTAKQTQVFRFGPAQTSGADAILVEGERVVMLRREYGYSRVMTEDGQPGFVANDTIAPAPPREKPRTTVASVNPFQNLPPLPASGTSTPGVSSANRAVLQTDPLFGGSELPPLPDAGDASKKPSFRVNVPKRESPEGSESPKNE